MKFSELTKPELDFILKYANLTSEEIEIFKLLSREKSIIEIAEHMMICERTVNRKAAKIKEKINKLGGLTWLKLLLMVKK